MSRADDLNGELLASPLFWVWIVCFYVHVCTGQGSEVKGVEQVFPNFSDHQNPLGSFLIEMMARCHLRALKLNLQGWGLEAGFQYVPSVLLISQVWKMGDTWDWLTLGTGIKKPVSRGKNRKSVPD